MKKICKFLLFTTIIIGFLSGVLKSEAFADGNWIPVYRLVKAGGGCQDHFYTASEYERDVAISNGYIYEKIAFYVSSTSFTGGQIVYRLRKDGTCRVRLYTSSATERDQAIVNGYVLENNLGYAYSYQVTDTYLIYRVYKASIGDRFYTIDYDEAAAAVADGYVWETSNNFGYVYAEPPNPPEPPPTPTLYSINNSDGDGTYTVSWSLVTGATTYTLQEKKDAGSWFDAYVGSSNQKIFSAQPPGTYYYRVKASNAAGDSEWSSTQSTIVYDNPDITVSPTSWNYGNVAVGTYSDKTFIIRNDGGQPLSVSGEQIIGTNSSQFSILNPSTLYLNSGESYNLNVRFLPTSAGSKSATLRISSNDPDENPKDIALSGYGEGQSQVPIAAINSITIRILNETTISHETKDLLQDNDPVKRYTRITFTGSGTDPDGGAIQAYKWISSRDGQIGTQASFSTTSLSVGTHTINFSVQDDEGVWSETANFNITIEDFPKLKFGFYGTWKAGNPGRYYNQGAHTGSDKYALDFNSGGAGDDYGLIIRVSTPGTVMEVQNETAQWCTNGGSGYGKAVKIRYDYAGKTYVTVYAHLTTIAVREGQSVIQGQEVGTCGDTGDSEGSHLHWSFKQRNANGTYTALVPEPIFETNSNIIQEIHNPQDFNSDNIFTPQDIIVVDEGNIANTSLSIYGYNHSSHYTTSVTGNPTVTAEWRPNIPVADRYRIDVQIPCPHATTERAEYTIVPTAGAEPIKKTINQNSYYNRWISIDTKNFNAGTEGYVSLNNATKEKNKEIVFDAIRFVKVGQGGGEDSDADYDGILDVNDNCPYTYNPEQDDIDSDGVGDVCDDDYSPNGMLEFTDDPIQENITEFEDEHITELRACVDTLRYNLFGWEPYDWADDSELPPQSGGPILASYITKLRASVEGIYDELEQSITWEEDIIADQTAIKAEHINELRQAIKNIW